MALQEKKLDDSSRLDVVDIARVIDMLLSLFHSSSGKGTDHLPGKVTAVLPILLDGFL